MPPKRRKNHDFGEDTREQRTSDSQLFAFLNDREKEGACRPCSRMRCVIMGSIQFPGANVKR